MSSYWPIKIVLILGLLAVAYFMLRPVKSASHLALRRIGVILIVILAGFSVIFADIVNPLARAIGVDSGVNLLVYFLVLTVFTQMATSYRRDSTNERKLTTLARAISLQSAPKPSIPLSENIQTLLPNSVEDASNVAPEQVTEMDLGPNSSCSDPTGETDQDSTH